MRKFKSNIPIPDYDYFMSIDNEDDRTNPMAIYRRIVNKGAADVLGGDKKWRLSGYASYQIVSGDSYIEKVSENDIVKWLKKTWKLSDIQSINLLTRGNVS